MSAVRGSDLRDTELRDGPQLDEAETMRRLARTWATPKGAIGWLSALDHKVIARRYLVTAMLFFLLAGLLALAMRLQLAQPDAKIIGPDRYNQIFTMHGSTMMFLFAVPVMQAVGIYLVPLMVGTRSISFPRLNAFNYWVFLFGGVMLYVAFVLDIGPDVGWFSYVPLSGPEYAPGKRADFWAQMITFTEVAALSGAVSLIATIFKQRAPGMSLDRMPLFVWATLVTSFMVVAAMPAVMLASSFLISDRLVATHFYNPAEGGDALLFQHLFWFFGHPEVYIIFLPALGMVSEIVATFARRPVFAYPVMVLALIGTALLAFGLWVHHMFATGLPRLGNAFFTASSMVIALPSGLQIFCWIATLWGRRPRLAVPLLFVLGFIIIFVLGGLTGVMLASVPLDLQLHDTYFVVAHFHYVLIGGAVFPLMGAFYFWFPKFTGRMLSEAAGRWHFWLFFLGFHLTFFPMHLLGLRGMPRRVYTYPAELGWGAMNLLASLGSLLIAAAILIFVLEVWRSLRRPADAPSDPWGGATLEWATSSPPPAYNFAHLPVVAGLSPLWQHPDRLPVMGGLKVEERELLLTTLIEARPDLRDPSPEPSIWPLLAALALSFLFVGSIFTPWAIVVGALPVGIATTLWFWPKGGGEVEQ